MAGPVIVLEFNELTPSLMDRFIAEGSLPAFEKLRRESIVAVSDAEEPPPFLEPWVQWVTVHTGLSRAEHKVTDLDDGPKLDVPRVWDIVSDAGKKVWICGSMNAGVQGRGFNGLFLPDPWTTSAEPYPQALFRPYYDFVRRYVQEYTRDKAPLSKADHLRFARFMATNGLSPKTVADTVRQLVSERGSGARWQRAAILDRIQWDVFRHHHRKLKPALATFFLNSTAHYQHYYWRNLEPDSFALRPSGEEQARYADAIRFGYRKMDEIVRDCLDLAGPDTTIVFCSALGQQPMSKYDADSGKQHFKPNDPASLLRFAGVEEPFTYAPLMAENFHLHFESEAAAEAAQGKLTALRMDGGGGARVLDVQREGARLHAGCIVVVKPPEDARVSTGTDRSAPFYELFYEATGLKSGMHHPDGILWIRTPERTHFEINRKVSLREIAPTLLALSGVPIPPSRFAFPPMPELAGGKPLGPGSGSGAPASPARPPVAAEG